VDVLDDLDAELIMMRQPLELATAGKDLKERL
jgi:hypothetical protein